MEHKKTTIRITGMHCPSCDILVRSKLIDQNEIVDVVPDQKTQTLTITHKRQLSLVDINSLLCEYGYKVTSLEDAVVSNDTGTLANIKEALLYAAILGAIFYILGDLSLIPDLTANPTLGLGSVFLLGLIASVSTCMATTGALLAGYIHLLKDKTKIPSITAIFLTGRIVSYGFFGYLLGSFGGIFSKITQFEGIINIFVAAILIVVGLDMLRIISLTTVMGHIPFVANIKSSFSKNNSSKSSYMGAFLLGVTTYLLPCGFSLTTQAYALSTKDPSSSAVIMTVFALGTIPALFSLGFLSKLRLTPIYSHLNKALGVIVLFVAISYIMNTLTLYGVEIPLGSNKNSVATENNAIPIVEGKQIVKMTATASGYSPNYFVVKLGIPVRWEIDGKEIFGCQGALQSPKAGVELTYLKPGENVIEFTPKEKGIIQFSCSMGMFSGKFEVI